AVGDTTNVAARLQGLAQPGEILLAQATRESVHALIDSESLSPVILRGKREPVMVHRLRGLKSPRPGTSGPGRPLSGFVGREREMADLHDALSHAESHHGQAVGIVSEPGMGKTRLLWEFRESLADGRV